MRNLELERSESSAEKSNSGTAPVWICALDISSRTVNNVELTEFSKGGHLLHRHGEHLEGAFTIEHVLDSKGQAQAIRNSIRSEQGLTEILASGIQLDGKSYRLDYLYDKSGAKGLFVGDTNGDRLKQLDPDSELALELIGEVEKIDFEAPCKKK